MRWFRLIVAYDGTGFHGWQAQPALRTVQGVLAEALAVALAEPVSRLEGAGRTDAGVHARGQAVSFGCPTALPARAIAPLVNRRLPRDVRVRESVEVEESFSARRTACARRYAYRLLHREDLLLERFAWQPRRPVEPAGLERATRAVEGARDFSAFRSAGSAPVSPHCRVTRAAWSHEPSGLRLDIVADRFLYRMVRNVVGTAVALAATADPAGAMEEVIASRERRRAGATAPACGLTLEQVFYPSEALT